MNAALLSLKIIPHPKYKYESLECVNIKAEVMYGYLCTIHVHTAASGL